MSQEIVKKKAQPVTDLTEMQRRFCEYLIFNEGRTTFAEAARHAGYSPDRANRIKALGNSIVPQIVTEIGKAIIKAEEEINEWN